MLECDPDEGGCLDFGLSSWCFFAPACPSRRQKHTKKYITFMGEWTGKNALVVFSFSPSCTFVMQNTGCLGVRAWMTGWFRGMLALRDCTGDGLCARTRMFEASWLCAVSYQLARFLLSFLQSQPTEPPTSCHVPASFERRMKETRLGAGVLSRRA